ncbi:Proteasome subunit alpha type-4 [Aduncisulcus paluster]|uniref:Proteasome subunit alpha type n=1 Tax=Aduncisulcus paluster TaxID=2918883 RepID=A0ABQ5KWG9_9EUKA|nr:Proteasome subunit alpha type-4 [Aduncisulcus paluster]
MSRRYDSRTTLFSPEGRIFQVEYAIEAINQTGASLGMICKDGILLLADKKSTSRLFETRQEKVYKLADHISCAVSGLTADANTLIDHCRIRAQRYLYTYGEPIPVEDIARELADVKQSYTQHGGLRPFGASLLIAGWDDKLGFQLYRTDPSGNYGGWRAAAIGRKSRAATGVLRGSFKEGMTFDEAKKYALSVFARTLDATSLSSDKLEMCVVKRERGEIVVQFVDGDEVQRLAEEAKKERDEKEEDEEESSSSILL